MAPTMANTNPAQYREQLFTGLYKEAFPAVAKYIGKRGGTYQQAKDVFQDALVIYYEKTVAGNFTHNANSKAYLMGIAKHLWLNLYKQAGKNLPLNGSPGLTAINEQEHYAGAKIMGYLETAGQKCADMLRAFYYDKLPVKDIAGAFGYGSIRSATVQKYKCLEKVRDVIKQKALTYEDFLE